MIVFKYYLKQIYLLSTEGDDKIAKSGRSPNDQRSDVKNPNNSDYKDDHDNKSDQDNPNNPA